MEGQEEKVWLLAVARVEAEGLCRSDSELLAVAQALWQCHCLVLILVVIPQVVQAALTLSAAQHSWTVVIHWGHFPAPLELLDFGCLEQDCQEKKSGKRSQGQSFQLSRREQSQCAGSQWKTSG